MNKRRAADGGILYTGPADFPRLSAILFPGIQPAAAADGLTLGEVQVLLFLANHPGNDTARDVVELRGLPKSQVSQAVDLLVSRGFLQRRPDETDRRVIHLAITEAGKPLAREAQEIQAACWQRIFSGLTDTERKTLDTLLERVFVTMEREMEGALRE